MKLDSKIPVIAKQNRQVSDAGGVSTKATVAATEAVTQAPKADGIDASGALTQAKALEQAQSGSTKSTRTTAADAAHGVLGLFSAAGQAAKKALSSMGVGVKAALIATALIGAFPTTAKADTVFLDHNNAPKEITVARDLARSKGEPFVLVRPTQESLDQLFAKAERGEVNIRHLILSGHSSGMSVWGQGADDNSYHSSISDYRQLKEKYPNAFNQVEHVTFMSCYAGSAGNSAQWAGVFPKARVISGFFGSGPSKEQPAAQQMLRNVEMASRNLPKTTLSPQQALITAKRFAQLPGANITNFGVRVDGAHHAIGQRVTPLEQARDRVEVLQNQAFTPFFEAQAGFENTPTNHARSPLRDYYNALHAYSNSLPADDWQAPQVHQRVEQTIRLIYFDVITAKFQDTHKDLIAQARTEGAGVGVDIPADLSKLTRAQILELNNKLDTIDASGQQSLQQLKDLIRDGLKNLDSAVIPATWIG